MMRDPFCDLLQDIYNVRQRDTESDHQDQSCDDDGGTESESRNHDPVLED
jgi:hypothetical protein